jgi:hypothetical protein
MHGQRDWQVSKLEYIVFRVIEHVDGWNDEEVYLVELKDVDAEFLKLRARGSGIWQVNQRLSTNFIPAP